jgi:hypothetical protein
MKFNTFLALISTFTFLQQIFTIRVEVLNESFLNMKMLNLNTTTSATASTAASTTASTTSTTTATFNFSTMCVNKKYSGESGILEAECTISGAKSSYKFNLNTCMDYKDNTIKKGGTGSPGIKKNCNCITMPKLVCICKANGDPSGTSFPSINLGDYVTVVSGKPYCKP